MIVGCGLDGGAVGAISRREGVRRGRADAHVLHSPDLAGERDAVARKHGLASAGCCAGRRMGRQERTGREAEAASRA